MIIKPEDLPKNERWIVTSLEVMKYNPIYRDKDGHYLKDEWTEFTHIGNTYNGELFTYDKYLLIEDMYVSSIEYFFKYFNCNKIRLTRPIYYLDRIDLNLRSKELCFFYENMKGRRVLNLQEALNVSRLFMRGAMDGVLFCKGDDEISVRFGYDFYLYLDTPRDKNKIKDYIENKIGLFASR